MYKIVFLLTSVLLACPLSLGGQSRYEVTTASFSTREYDEISPVLYNGKIVYCTNQEARLFIAFQNRRGNSLFNIFMVEPIDTNGYSPPEIFSRNLLSPYNDGPVTFSEDGKMVVYSRNIDSKARARNVVDQNNKLGLFFSKFIDGEWIYMDEFEYNSRDYSITTPCLSPDGQFLYFSSDMTGGFGGVDLYRSLWIKDKWGVPENLGKNINTPGNEVYPFVLKNGQLFFASDGSGGLGKKDIFFSVFENSAWSKPVHLDAPINSPEDDFGLYTDIDFKRGYFSTNRDSSDDIYSFSTLVPQLYNCDTLQENQYCFEFWDEQPAKFDTLSVSYEWEFSDGSIVKGKKVVHCLPGAGKYWAKLNIIDNTTDQTFYTQSSIEFELVDHVQPFISCSDTLIVNTVNSMSGVDSNLPGFTIEEYIWDFDDGDYRTGPEVNHQFKQAGMYYIKLGLIGNFEGEEDKEMRCVIKPVFVMANNLSDE